MAMLDVLVLQAAAIVTVLIVKFARRPPLP